MIIHSMLNDYLMKKYKYKDQLYKKIKIIKIALLRTNGTQKNQCSGGKFLVMKKYINLKIKKKKTFHTKKLD